MKLNSKIILAVPKGRIAKEIISLLTSLKLNPEKDFFEEKKNRKLLFETKTKNFFLTKVRNFDVPTIVAFGGADLGIVGSDVVNEFDYEGLLLKMLKEKCSENIPDVIGISALFDHSLGHVKMMASMIKKEISDDIIIVSGGNAATNRTKELLETDVDGVARGHGEEPLLELLQADDSKDYINKSSKWSTRKSGTKDLSLFTKYNGLSPLRWNLLEINDYQRFLGCGKGFFQQNNKERRIIHLTSSRGCPFKCVFCSSHSVNGYKLYYYDEEQFLSEVKFLHEEYGINIVAIEDDVFNINKKIFFSKLEGIDFNT